MVNVKIMNHSKLIFLLFFILISQILFSQNKKIIGKVYETYTEYSVDSQYNEKLKELNNYNIHLLKTNEIFTPGKLKLQSKNSSFEIIISAEELKIYNFLEFSTPNSSLVIEIDTIKNTPITIVLEDKGTVVKKPVIYLYPPTKQEITIIHDFKGKIGNTYPKYTDKWQVVAEPDGTLTSKGDNRKYKYLFWDGINYFPREHFDFKDGFLVRKENTVEFLETKLSEIGLNDSEINDFVVYWLPVLNENGDNLIHFDINNNIANTSFLNVNPKPDTEIIVFMEFRKWNLSDNVKIREQVIPKIVRKGFTLVEWGGSQEEYQKIE
jgi:hypothetical protein